MLVTESPDVVKGDTQSTVLKEVTADYLTFVDSDGDGVFDGIDEFPDAACDCAPSDRRSGRRSRAGSIGDGDNRGHIATAMGSNADAGDDPCIGSWEAWAESSRQSSPNGWTPFISAFASSRRDSSSLSVC